MNVLGYGEDGLTYWAITRELKQILDRLGDGTALEEVLVFFRPSFGRGAAPQFGEFDFIIVTPKALYLGESKWAHSPEIKGSKDKRKVDLTDTQIKRHNIFAEYYQVWKEEPSATIEDFLSACNVQITGRKTPQAHNQMAKTLFSLLEKVNSFQNPPIENLILVLDTDGTLGSAPKGPLGFRVICINAQGSMQGEFLSM